MVYVWYKFVVRPYAFIIILISSSVKIKKTLKNNTKSIKVYIIQTSQITFEYNRTDYCKSENECEELTMFCLSNPFHFSAFLSLLPNNY